MGPIFLYSTAPSPHEDHILRLAGRRRPARSDPVRAVALRTAQQSPTDEDLAMLGAHFCGRSIAATLVDVGLDSRHDAAEPEVVERIRTADLVLVGGGDPRRLYEQTRQTPALQALQDSSESGAVIAACSAGAAAFGAGMVDGPKGEQCTITLWAWFADLLIAPHFGHYDHSPWLNAFPDSTMLGIPDEAMALISEGRITSLGRTPLTIIGPNGRQQDLVQSRQLPVPFTAEKPLKQPRLQPPPLRLSRRPSGSATLPAGVLPADEAGLVDPSTTRSPRGGDVLGRCVHNATERCRPIRRRAGGQGVRSTRRT